MTLPTSIKLLIYYTNDTISFKAEEHGPKIDQKYKGVRSPKAFVSSRACPAGSSVDLNKYFTMITPHLSFHSGTSSCTPFPYPSILHLSVPPKCPLQMSSRPEPQEPEESVATGSGSHFPT